MKPSGRAQWKTAAARCAAEARGTVTRYGLADLLEVTFAYSRAGKGRWVNRTLFGDFAGLLPAPVPGESAAAASARLRAWCGGGLRSAVPAVRERLEEASSRLRAVKAEIPEGTSGGLVSRSVSYALSLLRFVSGGAVFEAEKAGLPSGLSAKDVRAAAERLEALEAPLFGGLVRSDPGEALGAADFLEQKIMRLRENVTPAQERVLLDSVAKFRSYAPAGTPAPGRPEPAAVPRGLSFAVPRRAYVAAFREALAYYGVLAEVVVEERGSMYDGDGKLHVPSTPAYASMTAAYALSLLEHEIETHFVVWDNNLRLFGGLRGAGNLAREEGLAMFMESVGRGVPYASVDARMAPVMLAAETMEGAEFFRWMEAYERLRSRGGPAEAFRSALRAKRCYPMSAPGCQHKDTTYDRGVSRVRDLALSGGSVRDLYVAKVSFRDVAPALRSARAAGFSHKVPHFLGEAVRFSLLGGPAGLGDFPSYLAKKYPFWDFAESGAPWVSPAFRAAADAILRAFGSRARFAAGLPAL